MQQLFLAEFTPGDFVVHGQCLKHVGHKGTTTSAKLLGKVLVCLAFW